MDGEAEETGGSTWNSGPRDRVIVGSLYPYRLLPARPSGSVGWWDSGDPRSHLAPFNFKRRVIGWRFSAPLCIPRRRGPLCRDRRALDSTVESIETRTTDKRRNLVKEKI